MKFQIFKTSSFNEEKCPCKNSIKENEDFFVNINTLEQLLELIDEVETSIIISKGGYDENEYTIEIYDDWRE